MKLYNKLVRDKIPQIIEANGELAEVQVLKLAQYSKMLNIKLQEELSEFLEANDNNQVEELADLVEGVYTILKNKELSIKEFEKVRLKKKDEKGGFDDRLLLVSISEQQVFEDVELDKEQIFMQFSSNEVSIAREIDDYIVNTSGFKDIKLKTPITDCLGYKVGNSPKFASLTTKNKKSLILHIGGIKDKLGLILQVEIDKLLGRKYPRTKSDNLAYLHQAYIKLDWVNDLEKIKPFIVRAYNQKSDDFKSIK